jgi:hypothetical protein
MRGLLAQGAARNKERPASPAREFAITRRPRYQTRMPPRARKFLGGLVMILFVMTYALLAMALAQARIVQESGHIVQTLFFAVLGMGWVLPLLPLVRWMERQRPE